MSQYDVLAMSVNTLTGEVTSEPRTERIDTETNELFGDATGPWEVEDTYHAFWNRLNASWERDFPEEYKDKVIVLSVKEVGQ